jgi:uncharacterized protein involved in exopolysaccharide biosynthesis
MNTLAQEDFEEPLDLGALLGRLQLKRWWIVASVLLFSAAFAAAAFLMTPVYRATTILAPATTTRRADTAGILGQLGGLASAAGLGLGPRDAETEEALAVLSSREFTESFISSHNLMPKLFPNKWDATAGKWKVDAEHQPTPARAYKLFDQKIRTVVQDKKTGLVSLQIDWRDRKEGADWANELVRLLNQEMRERAITNADASVSFLEKELQTTVTVEARDAISRLMESQVKQRMIAHVTQDYSFRVVDRALPADRDDPVRPKKLLLVVAGPLVGLALGILGVLGVHWLRSKSAMEVAEHRGTSYVRRVRERSK